MNGMARGDRFRVEHSTRVLRSATCRKHRRGAAQWADPLAQMPRTPAFAAGRREQHSGRVLHPEFRGGARSEFHAVLPGICRDAAADFPTP